jgi:hypothetical protein
VTFAIIYITVAASYSVVVESVRGQIEKSQGKGKQDDVSLPVRIKQQLRVSEDRTYLLIRKHFKENIFV